MLQYTCTTLHPLTCPNWKCTCIHHHPHMCIESIYMYTHTIGNIIACPHLLSCYILSVCEKVCPNYHHMYMYRASVLTVVLTAFVSVLGFGALQLHTHPSVQPGRRGQYMYMYMYTQLVIVLYMHMHNIHIHVWVWHLVVREELVNHTCTCIFKTLNPPP